MQLVFSDQVFPSTTFHSIFLAGPSPRNKEQLDWRHKALEILKSLDYKGSVYIPSPKDKFYHQTDAETWDYNAQIDWEIKARSLADQVLFWIPRSLKDGVYALTTNIEFGEDLLSGKLLYGSPKESDNCRYLDLRCEREGVAVHRSLEDLLKAATDDYKNGVQRNDGEQFVPHFIWHTDQFQSWYNNVKKVGNKLTEAKVLHHSKLKPSGIVFSYTLWVKVWITAEHRYKENEYIFSRKDISCILPYYVDMEGNTKVILIKEFRSPVNNQAGYVYELPGGSSPKKGVDPKVNAQHELKEETGLDLESSRFNFVAKRQLVATLSTHTADLYKVAISKQEYEGLIKSVETKQLFGVAEDSERTSIVIVDLKDLFSIPLDYSMIGMIYHAFLG